MNEYRYEATQMIIIQAIFADALSPARARRAMPANSAGAAKMPKTLSKKNGSSTCCPSLKGEFTYCSCFLRKVFTAFSATRTLPHGPAGPCRPFAYCILFIIYASAASPSSGFCVFLITRSTATSKMIPTGSEIHTLFVNPATIYVTKDTAATVNAYGSWVET